MTKSVILTGLRANNDLHIGNYFGAMLPMVEMANQKAGDYQINMFIPDLHSFTTPIDHEILQEQIFSTARMFAAAGLPLENDDILLYRQSYIPAHSELTIILNSFSGFDEMRRMTQFKDKSLTLSSKRIAFNALSEIANGSIDTLSDQKKRAILSFFEKLSKIAPPLDNYQQAALEELYKGNLQLQQAQAHALCTAINESSEYIVDTPVTVGLFDYPVLMATDILLYDARYIPVGEDQTQHLEFTRDISTRMNNKFGSLFTIPESVEELHEFFKRGQALRIKDLVDPSKKMSKSDESAKGVIFLNDSPEVARKKIMSATTDNLARIKNNPIEQPGISNLLQILSLIRGEDIQDTEIKFDNEISYGNFKNVVANEVCDFLSNFQNKLKDIDNNNITKAFERSEMIANEQANTTLHKVQQAVGLRPKA